MLGRLQALLAALWGGLLLSVAGIAAPTAFAVLERVQAGKFVGRLFELEAQASLAAALLLVMIERRLQRDAEHPAMTSPALLLPLAALFLTVVGYYGMQPLMEAARSMGKTGQGALSFGALHAISSALFGLKTTLVLVLAWRLMLRPGH